MEEHILARSVIAPLGGLLEMGAADSADELGYFRDHEITAPSLLLWSGLVEGVRPDLESPAAVRRMCRAGGDLQLTELLHALITAALVAETDAGPGARLLTEILTLTTALTDGTGRCTPAGAFRTWRTRCLPPRPAPRLRRARGRKGGIPGVRAGPRPSAGSVTGPAAADGHRYPLADPTGMGESMSADSRAERPKAQRPQRSLAGNVLFAVAAVVVLATMVLGAFAAGALLLSPLSAVVPEDGEHALAVGCIGLGGITGLVLPLILFGMVRGSEDTPRVGPGAAARKILALLVFAVYLLVVAVVVAQLGYVLPRDITTTVAVFAVGFSWMPLAMVPWEKLGLGGVVPRPKSRKAE